MSSSPDTVNTLEIDITDQPTKSVTFSLARATVVREIKDVHIKPRANEVIVSGLDPKLDPDSVRVDGYGAATITNIQTEVVPRKNRFEDVYPEDDDSAQSDPDQNELDGSDSEEGFERDPDRLAIDAIKQGLRDAEAELAAAKDVKLSAVKVLEFLNQYGTSLNAEVAEVSKISEFLDMYREQRTAQSTRHQQSSAEVLILEKKVQKICEKLSRAEKAYAKKKEAATRHIRKQQEKKAHEKEQKRLAKERIRQQRLQFWTRSVGQVVIHLDGSSADSSNSSRRSSIISSSEKHSGDPVSLILTYVVPFANWDPRYELRINTPESSAKLIYRAEVGNSTAETWRDANITFSTSQTFFSGLREKIPVLEPWNIKLDTAQKSDTENHIWANGLRSQKEMPPNPAVNRFANNNNNNNKTGGLIGAATATSQGPTGARAFGTVSHQESRQDPGSSNTRHALFGASTAPENQARQSAGLFGAAPAPAAAPPQDPSGLNEEGYEESDGDEDAETLFPQPNALGHQNSQRQDYGLTTSYELAGKHTITPSYVKRRHVITELELKSVTMSHVIIPKLRRAAFLKARLTNTSSTRLLRGNAGMTIDGTFLGSTVMPNCEPGAFVDLSLGVDPSIQVMYAKPTVRRATSGFFNKDNVAVFTRTCWIENNKKTTASITVIDQVPVSEDENLRLNILEPKGLQEENDVVKLDSLLQKGEKGSGKVHLMKNGFVKWVLKLHPGKDVRLVLEYESRIPAGQKIIGL